MRKFTFICTFSFCPGTKWIEGNSSDTADSLPSRTRMPALRLHGTESGLPARKRMGSAPVIFLHRCRRLVCSAEFPPAGFHQRFQIWLPTSHPAFPCLLAQSHRLIAVCAVTSGRWGGTLIARQWSASLHCMIAVSGRRLTVQSHEPVMQNTFVFRHNSFHRLSIRVLPAHRVSNCRETIQIAEKPFAARG